MAAGGENVVGVLGLFLVQLAEQSLTQDFREADDGIERRAQLMRHVGEELRLVPVGGFDLPALVLDLTEQPGVLDRQDGLRGKGLQKIRPLLGQIPDCLSPNRQAAHDLLFAKQRNSEEASITKSRQAWAAPRGSVIALFQDVRNLHWCRGIVAARPVAPSPRRSGVARSASTSSSSIWWLARRMKLFDGLIVFVNDPAIGSGELDRMGDDAW